MESMDAGNGRGDGALSAGISVLVPVYNGSATIEELVERLGATLSTLVPSFEVILINDGSRDKSWDVIVELASQYEWVRGINMMRNCGQHNAVLCGVRSARYDVTITMDDDLQHPPETIPILKKKLDECYDVVYGIPEHEQHGFFRDAASRITKAALQSAMGAETARQVCAFRMFRTRVREAFADFESSFICFDVLLTWATSRFAAAPVRHDPRTIGASNYNFTKLVTVAVNMITTFSTWPLQLASILGFTLTVFGLGMLVYVLAVWLTVGTHVAGFSFLASSIAVFSGTQLFCLGVMGEYIARIFCNSMGKPSYVVRDSTDPIGCLGESKK